MNKFIEARGYYKAKDGSFDIDTGDVELEENKQYRLLMIPGGGHDYHSRLYDSLLNITSAVFGATSLNVSSIEDNITEARISLQKAYILRELGSFLGYLNNCTSWRENHSSIQDYDKDTLLNRLDKLKRLIEQ